MATTTFQRCTNKSMGDRILLQNENDDQPQQPQPQPQPPIIFGASDELGSTPRQIRGAAVVGGVAGALLGGPVAGIAGAASAAYAAAKRECEIGEAARVAGDTVADASEFLLANQTIHQTLEQYRYRSRRQRQRQKQAHDNDNNHNNESVQASRRRSFVDECSARASQIKTRASLVKAQVKERVSNPFHRRRSKLNASNSGNEVEDDEFHDCCDTQDADFEDAMEEEDQEQVLVKQ